MASWCRFSIASSQPRPQTATSIRRQRLSERGRGRARANTGVVAKDHYYTVVLGDERTFPPELKADLFTGPSLVRRSPGALSATLECGNEFNLSRQASSA